MGETIEMEIARELFIKNLKEEKFLLKQVLIVVKSHKTVHLKIDTNTLYFKGAIKKNFAITINKTTFYKIINGNIRLINNQIKKLKRR